jgi:PKD domain
VINSLAPVRARRVLIALLAFMLGVAFVVVSLTAPANAKDDKNYTVEFTSPSPPATVVGGLASDYVVKFTNAEDNTVTQKAGTFLVDFGAFHVNSVTINSASGHNWAASVSGNQVTLTAASGGERIGVGENVTITVNATAPSSSMTYTLATAADQEDHGNFRGGNKFTTESVLNVTVVAVDAGGPYTGDEGADIAIAGSPGVGGAITGVGWDVDNHARCAFDDSGAASTTVSCDDNGSYTLTYTVTVGASSVSDTATLTVYNVAPSVSITAPAASSFFDVGQAVSLTAPFSDAGKNDSHTAVINWGDGSTQTGTVNETVGTGTGTVTSSHSYTTGGTKTIAVTVTDDDGGTNTAAVTITIATPCTAPCTLTTPQGEKWSGSIETCDDPQCAYFTTGATGKLVADITVLTDGSLYVVLTTTDKGPSPGNAYVEADGVRLPDCGTNGPPKCVHIQRVTGTDGKLHTQYEVFWDGDPRLKFG